MQKSTFFVCVFFFHHRESPLQKSHIGMYRSLLYQLLTQDPIAASDTLLFTIKGKEFKLSYFWWHYIDLENYFWSSVWLASRKEMMPEYFSMPLN